MTSIFLRKNEVWSKAGLDLQKLKPFFINKVTEHIELQNKRRAQLGKRIVLNTVLISLLRSGSIRAAWLAAFSTTISKTTRGYTLASARNRRYRSSKCLRISVLIFLKTSILRPSIQGNAYTPTLDSTKSIQPKMISRSPISWSSTICP